MKINIFLLVWIVLLCTMTSCSTHDVKSSETDFETKSVLEEPPSSSAKNKISSKVISSPPNIGEELSRENSTSESTTGPIEQNNNSSEPDNSLRNEAAQAVFHLVDENGSPIEMVNIYITNVPEGGKEFGGYTDHDGKIYWSNPVPGTYTFKAEELSKIKKSKEFIITISGKSEVHTLLWEYGNPADITYPVLASAIFTITDIEGNPVSGLIVGIDVNKTIVLENGSEAKTEKGPLTLMVPSDSNGIIVYNNPPAGKRQVFLYHSETGQRATYELELPEKGEEHFSLLWNPEKFDE